MRDSEQVLKSMSIKLYIHIQYMQTYTGTVLSPKFVYGPLIKHSYFVIP